MVKILLSGASGRMGQFMTAAIEQREGCMVVAGFDVVPDTGKPFPVFPPCEYEGEADVIVDFSRHDATPKLLEYAIRRKLPIVIATTGHTEDEKKAIYKASEKIPVFYTGNMSLGVNLLKELAKRAAAVLGDDFDVEIVEKHHNQKIDAPSGTALMLADAVVEGLDKPMSFVYDRHSSSEKRGKNEIGIHSVRGGTIVGEHEIIFAGNDEILTLSHSARSKSLFSTGALNAAIFMLGRQPGLYHMGHLLDSSASL